MSDLPNPTVEPLWGFPRVRDAVLEKSENGGDTKWVHWLNAIRIARCVEDEYQAERQRLYAHIAELERANAELEARVAGGLDTALADVVEWQHQQFPNANPEGITEHLLEEARELYDHPRDAEEVADVQLLLAGLASCLGINLADVVRAKLAKNKTRKWGKPNANGVIKHVEGDSDE